MQWQGQQRLQARLEQKQEQEQEHLEQVDEQRRWLQTRRCNAPNLLEDGVFQHFSPKAEETTAGLLTQ